MSPEQVGGGGIDARSDIFLWGVILYELLAGKFPYVIHKDPPYIYYESPPQLKNIPIDLERICFKSIAREKKERYQNVRESDRRYRTFFKRSQY